MQFITNAWYVAAFSEHLSGDFMTRTILDLPVLLYRTQSGKAAALLDLCPHRFAPLSMGVMQNGNVQCPYHGLEFDQSGRCVLNPHGSGARPSSLNVRAFPLVEQHGLVWLWMGDPARADAAAIPDYSFRASPQRRNVGGYFTAACSYRLLIDNLMDLGHAQFVHRSNAQNDAFDKVERSVSVENGVIENLMKFPGASPTVLAKNLLNLTDERIDIWTDIKWHAVGAMVNFIAFALAGTPKAQSYNTLGTHIVTPETATTSHYFYGAARNFALEDPAIDETYRAWQRQALALEDKPVTEAVERRLAVAQQLGLAPAMLACDEAAVRVSRALDQLAHAEQA